MIKIAEQTKLGQENRTIPNQDSVTAKPSNLDRALLLLNLIIPQQDEMETLVKMEKRYEMLLYEPELLFKYRKGFAAFLIAFRLYNGYKTGRMIRADDASNYINQIRFYDKELADDVEKIFPLVEEGVGVFSDLLAALQKWKRIFYLLYSNSFKRVNHQSKIN